MLTLTYCITWEIALYKVRLLIHPVQYHLCWFTAALNVSTKSFPAYLDMLLTETSTLCMVKDMLVYSEISPFVFSGVYFQESRHMNAASASLLYAS